MMDKYYSLLLADIISKHNKGTGVFPLFQIFVFFVKY